jgi:transcriptional regulator with XRE-family HTH domain
MEKIGRFVPVMAVDREGWHRGRDADWVGIEGVLLQSMTDLGVSKYQFAKLLGMRSGQSHLSQWLEGRARPGSLYLLRLVALYHIQEELHRLGSALCYASYVDWSKAEVVFRRGTGKEVIQRLIDQQKARVVPTSAPEPQKVQKPVTKSPLGKMKPRVPGDDAYL